MRRLTLPLALMLPAFALAATPTYTLVDLGTAPGLAWAPVPPSVGNSASTAGGFYGSLGGGITYIYQQLPGAAVGASAIPDSICDGKVADFHAFLFLQESADSGTMQDLGTLDGCQSAALSLNASHVVVGWAQAGIGTVTAAANGGLPTAFVWHNGTMQALPSLLQTITSIGEANGNSSSANGINNAGEIVGETAQLLTTGVLAQRAVLWQNSAVSKPLELQFALGNSSGTVIFTNALGIDCQGNIAVTGYPLNHSPSDVHSYLLVRQGAPRSCPE